MMTSDMRRDYGYTDRRTNRSTESMNARDSEDLRAMNETQESLINLIRDALLNSLKATGAVTREAGNVARGVIKESLQTGEELGVRTMQTGTNLTKAVVGGVLDTVGSISSSAMSAGVAMAVGMITGLKDVASAALPRTKPVSSRYDATGSSLSEQQSTSFETSAQPDMPTREPQAEPFFTRAPAYDESIAQPAGETPYGMAPQPDPEAPYDEEFIPKETKSGDDAWVVRGW